MTDSLNLSLLAAWLECGAVSGSDSVLKGFMRGTSLSGSATPLVDLNGELLMYRVPIERKGRKTGYLDVGVHEAFSNPLQKIGNRAWDEDVIREKTEYVARQADPSVDVSASVFVVYNYPRVGVQFATAGGGLLLVDAFSYSLVPEVEPDGVGGPRTLQRWSILDNLAPVLRAENTRRRSGWLQALGGDSLRVGSLSEITSLSLKEACALMPEIKVCSGWIRYGRGLPNHHCFEMRAQKTDFWCAAASVQMLMDFYRYEYQQETLALDLGLGTLQTARDLPCARDEFKIIDVIERRSRSALTAEVNNCPFSFWPECKEEIDSNRPLILIARQHVRVVVGYIKVTIPASDYSKFGLALYDPLPVNQGEIVFWEAFEAGRCRSLYTARL